MAKKIIAWVTIICIAFMCVPFNMDDVYAAEQGIEVTFDLNGGYILNDGVISYENYTLYTSNRGTITYGIIDARSSDENLVFVGWCDYSKADEPIYTAAQIYGRGIVFDSNTTLTAVYKECITVSCEWEGQTKKVKFAVGECLRDNDMYHLPGFTRKGYTMCGWIINDPLSSENNKAFAFDEIGFYHFNRNTILIPDWEKAKYTLYFDTKEGEYEKGDINNKKRISGTITSGTTIGEAGLAYIPLSGSEAYIFAGYRERGNDIFYFFRDGMTSDELNKNSFYNYIPDDYTGFEAVWKKKINVRLVVNSNDGYFSKNDDEKRSNDVWEITKSLGSDFSIKEWYPIIANSNLEPRAYDKQKVFVGWKKNNDNNIYSTNDLLSMKFTNDTVFTAQWKTIISNNGEKNQQRPDEKNQQRPDEKKYSNEWINGKWYDENGNQTYSGTLSWKNNSTGWWVEDSAGWYPQSQWQKIDGVWYYFKPDGYMASAEYYGGYWFNSDGSWDDQYELSWKSNSTGWWVEDKSGWWPSSKWLKIDGSWYYFDVSGYMVTSQYVDGYWLGADGACW